jgi:hypothetical protein
MLICLQVLGIFILEKHVARQGRASAKSQPEWKFRAKECGRHGQNTQSLGGAGLAEVIVYPNTRLFEGCRNGLWQEGYFGRRLESV